MDSQTLQDRISKGMGVAARKCGRPYTVYRPDGVIQPVSPQRRVMQLLAVFTPGGLRSDISATYAQTLWRGIFDASYTQPGDYVVGAADTYFVATQTPGDPVQCVQTNRVVTIVRPAPAIQGGYSGFFSDPADLVITLWPASLLESNGNSFIKVGESRFGGWTLLLPRFPVNPQVADIVSDDLGGAYSVSSARKRLLVGVC